jgi:hypothetical protein
MTIKQKMAALLLAVSAAGAVVLVDACPLRHG